MTQDVRQWLVEIRALQQKVAEVEQERDAAQVSAVNWRGLYETEARQRRADTHLTQQTIASLQTELEALRYLPVADSHERQTVLQEEVDRQQEGQELKTRLLQALMECDRLGHALQTEQTAHAQTRRSLTAALGDTVDLLTKERNIRSQACESEAGQLEVAPAAPAVSSKILSLELPQFD